MEKQRSSGRYIGPAHMRPRLNGDGVWKGTHITEVKFGGT